MMDNLTAILCDTSPMMAPHNYTERSLPPQGQNKISQHSMPSGTVLLNSVSQISNINAPLSSVTHSSPSNINIFSSSDQIHIPSKMDSGFDDRSSVSVFSDSFPEIVPSWLTHDFMKVSDNLNSPGILSNITDIYSTNQENEHLEMLDLGFTPELTSQDVTNNMNRSYNDSQKLLDNLSVQRYSGNESLLIPTFNDINNPHLHMSMDKNNTMQYLKFKQNGPDINSTQSLMKATLPCETELLHLPLPSNLNEQCLNTVSSPSMLSSSQSQSHPVDVVCDKLPQINLSHLDSLLGNETSLTDIQLLRHDFSNVHSSENNCNPQSNSMCLDSYNSNGNMLTCNNTANILGSNITPLPQSQDVSVQVNTLVADNFVPYKNCISCEKVTPESSVEVVQCFKCKFCDYVNLHKCAIVSHINVSHSTPPESSNIMIRSNLTNALYVGGQSEAHFGSVNNTASDALSILSSNAKMTNLVSVRSTMQNKGSPNNPMSVVSQNDMNKSSTNRRILPKTTGRTSENDILNNTLNAPQNKVSNANRILAKKPISKKNNSNSNIFNNSQDNANKNLKQMLTPENPNQIPNHINSSMSQNDVSKMFKKIIAKKPEELPVNNISSMPQNNFNKNSSRVIVSKKPEDISKNNPESTGHESTVKSTEEKQSSFKKAWQKKITRELGTFICEFKGCNVRFRALDNLEYHKKCHTLNSRAFTCPECQTTLDNWGTMAGHLWRNHGNDMELHACDQCPFRTYSLSRLENVHKRIHTNEFPFLCDTCGKGFKNGKQLTNHRAIHRAVKNKQVNYIKCEICLVSFSSRTMLLSHQRSIHYRLKPFNCNYCDYSASKKSTVNLHMRLHTGEKPFKCDSCDYQTADHNTLRRHKMRHSGDKKYKCVLCTYTCTTSHYYKTHLRKKHPESEGLVFCCNLCNFNTIKQEIYLSHLYKHEHNHVNPAPKENTLTDLQTTDEIFPFAEAMNNGLSDCDNIFSDINISKTMQSFSNCLNINMMSVSQQGAD